MFCFVTCNAEASEDFWPHQVQPSEAHLMRRGTVVGGLTGASFTNASHVPVLRGSHPEQPGGPLVLVLVPCV